MAELESGCSMPELRPGPHTLTGDEILRCQLVTFARDHLFDLVDKELIEAFRKYFRKPGAKLFVLEPGDDSPSADEFGLDFIRVEGVHVWFSIDAQVVQVSASKIVA